MYLPPAQAIQVGSNLTGSLQLQDAFGQVVQGLYSPLPAFLCAIETTAPCAMVRLACDVC